MMGRIAETFFGAQCMSKSKIKTCQPSIKPDQQHRVEIDLGNEIGADEVSW